MDSLDLRGLGFENAFEKDGRTMKLRFRSRIKGIVVPAIAALFLGISLSACSSSGEGEGAGPDAEMVDENGAANSDPLANNANAANGEEGAAANANGAGAANGNEELSNLVSDGSENAASNENPAVDPALNSNVGSDPFANPANQGAANAEAGLPLPNGESNGADPFANANTTGTEAAAGEVPANAPADNAFGGAVPVPPMENTITAEEAPGATETASAIPNTNVPAWNAPANTAGANAAPAGNVAENNENAGNENNTNSENSENSAGGGAPVVGYVPESGSRMAYFVASGDTLGTISQKVYGDKSRWKELSTANNLANPNKIYPGDVVFYTLDDASKAFADKYEGAARQTVTVNSGETLSGIAARIYGYEGAWRTLWKENPTLSNPDKITAGMTLTYRSFGNVASTDTTIDSQEEVTELEEASTSSAVALVSSEILE